MLNSGDSCTSETLEDESKDVYHQCELRLGLNQTSSPTFLLELFFVLALIGATMFLAYRYYSSDAVGKSKYYLEEISLMFLSICN